MTCKCAEGSNTVVSAGCVRLRTLKELGCNRGPAVPSQPGFLGAHCPTPLQVYL
jgi:hypothetical protein